MPVLLLKDINFGKVDAETEIAIDQGRYFDEVYLDPFECIEKVRSGSFVIHGRKGTGKSAFSYYLQRRGSANLFYHKLNYSMKDIEQIVQMPELKNAEEAHIHALWRWIFLCVLGKFVLDDQSIKLSTTDRSEFERFYKLNQGYCSPGALELKQQIENEKIEIKVAALNRLLQANGLVEVQSTNGRANFLKILNPLADLLAAVFQSTFRDKANEYFIVVDNLDHGYKGNADQRKAILGLLRAAKDLFTRFHELGIRLYPVILIRTDMLSDLMYEADTNKIIHANGLKLNWYDHDQFVGNQAKVPLRNMISNRVKYSYNKKKVELNEDGWDVLFKDWPVGEKNSFKFLIDKTLYRPRDLISILDLIQKRYGERYKITKDMIESVSDSFGEYMIGEWQNELAAHYDQSQIEFLFNSLKNFCNEFRFNYKNFCALPQKSNSLSYPELLNIAYEYGLICIVKDRGESTTLTWSHRPNKYQEDGYIDENTEFSIHFSFRDHFKIKRRKLF